MAKRNQKAKTAVVAKTHEGGPVYRLGSPEQLLERSVASCLLWESEFYEDGEKIADRIAKLAREVKPQFLAELAVKARSVYNLRHAPLWLLVQLIAVGRGQPGLVSNAIFDTIQRADELAELLSLYWIANPQASLSAQLKKGLARAFNKFSAYQLSKYNRDSQVKLRDVLFLVCPKPTSPEQSELFKKLADQTLEAPDTWEVALSRGDDKNATFTRLLNEENLGYLALLRNLRNMQQAGVEDALIEKAILARKGARRVLPFRYLAAARVVPRFEPQLDQALIESLADLEPLAGETIVLVDVSGSMDARLSGKSDMTRVDAAATLASIIPGKHRVFSFSNRTVECPPRMGMAGVDAIIKSQSHGGTDLGGAVEKANTLKADRLIVITDEQSRSYVPAPKAKRAYMINVASAQHGVSYRQPWVHFDGFSENVLRFIQAHEAQADR